METSPRGENIDLHVNDERLEDDELSSGRWRHDLLSLKSSDESIPGHEGHDPRSVKSRSHSRNSKDLQSSVRENYPGITAEIRHTLTPRPHEEPRSTRPAPYRSPRAAEARSPSSPRSRRSQTVGRYRRPSIALEDQHLSLPSTPAQVCDTDHLRACPLPVKVSINSQLAVQSINLQSIDRSNHSQSAVQPINSKAINRSTGDQSIISRPTEESINPQSTDINRGYDRLIDRLTSRDIDINQDVTINHYRTQSVDRKVRQEIINGLNYLEKRKNELMEFNQRLQIDVESLARLNEQLKEELVEKQLQCSQLESENDEVKARLDILEKEKSRLSEQSLREWKSRIKVEEMYVEIKRDMEKEIKRMRLKIDTATSTDSQQKTQISELERIREELSEQLDRLHAERETQSERLKQFENNMEEWKTRYESKCKEFNAQGERFLALKKSFNELHAENERLQNIYGDSAGWVRSSHAACRCIQRGPNSTWPTNTKTGNMGNPGAPRPTGGDSICIVDLTSQFNPGDSLGSSLGRLSRGTTGTGSSTGEDLGSSLPSIKIGRKSMDISQLQQQQSNKHLHQQQQLTKQNVKQQKQQQQQLSGAALPPVANAKH